MSDFNYFYDINLDKLSVQYPPRRQPWQAAYPQARDLRQVIEGDGQFACG
ncbi:hypothetical protein GCM10027098_04850 [Bowmanella dokdonensis]